MSTPRTSPEIERLDKLILWRKNWGADGELTHPIIFPRRRTPTGVDK